MTEKDLLLLWGKTHKTNPLLFHPVLFHLLDVANVARLMWHEWLSPVLRQRIALALGLSSADAEIAVTLLAGLHDLGKAAPAFQQQVPRLAVDLPKHGLKLEDSTQKEPHGFISAYDLPRLFETGACGWTMPEAAGQILANITGAHHGTFPRSENLSPYKMNRSQCGGPAWTEARNALAQRLAVALFGAVPALTTQVELTDPGSVPLLTGLISVADWVGSSHHFEITGPMAVDAYAELSKKRARQALEQFGWLPKLEPAAPTDFQSIFPFAPNELQKRVQAIANARKGAYLLILEMPMGKGKTEAALYAADRAFCQKLAAGLYVALPTQATSNAMFDRVREDYLETRGHHGLADFHLLHGNALLSEAYQALRDAVIYDTTVGGKDTPKITNGRVGAQSWFAGRKRSLLAPFGVGTIDQSLLSVLQTRHWFVRLFGLANKVIIFDEVHAYDTYMSELLKTLIQWLAQINCTVVVLSATLPSDTRRSLVDAFRRDASSALPDFAYPRITWVDETSEDVVPVPAEKPYSVMLDFSNDAPETVAFLLQDQLKDGGYAAVICNTVKRAQAVFSILQEQVPDWDVTLFHARMPFGWRRDRETLTLEKFGKKAQRQQGERAVLISTQVAEQSLDLDWDWLASDMAPVDLLLQRVGRLHRHADRNETRPQHLKIPRLMVLCDGERFGPPPSFGDSRFVYDPFVLLHSWLALRGKNALELPDEIETLVEEVYVKHTLQVPDAAWETALTSSRDALEEQRAHDQKQAAQVAIGPPKKPRALMEKFSRGLDEDEDPTTHPTLQAATRNGDPSVQVVCAIREGDALLLPDGDNPAVALTDEYDLPTARRLLDASLPLSHKGLFHALAHDDALQPKVWRENPHFRYHRLLPFGTDWRCTVGSYHLHLHKRLGLVIQKVAGDAHE